MSPLKFLALVLATLVVLAALASGGIVLYGRERLWTELFGPPDTGAYDFDMPTRTGKMNDALACPDGRCTAFADTMPTPLFTVPAETLYAAARDALADRPGSEIVADDPERLQVRVVVRTPTLRFPDTVSVRVRTEAPGVASLWLYSRSQIGHADLGTNAARLRALVDDLAGRLPNRPPVAPLPPAG